MSYFQKLPGKTRQKGEFNIQNSILSSPVVFDHVKHPLNLEIVIVMKTSSTLLEAYWEYTRDKGQRTKMTRERKEMNSLISQGETLSWILHLAVRVYACGFVGDRKPYRGKCYTTKKNKCCNKPRR